MTIPIRSSTNARKARDLLLPATLAVGLGKGAKAYVDKLAKLYPETCGLE
jgi:Tfp pilus assembly protein PilF